MNTRAETPRRRAAEPHRYVSPTWLAEHLTHVRVAPAAPHVRVLDVRSDGEFRARSGGYVRVRAATPKARREFIPGAAVLDVSAALFDDGGVPVTALELALAMSSVGAGDEHMIVLVDDAVSGAALAADWLLRRYGHEESVVLAGGHPRWLSEGRPLVASPTRHPHASFTVKL